MPPSEGPINENKRVEDHISVKKNIKNSMIFLVIIENLLRRITKIQREYLKGINKLCVVRDLTNNIVEQRRRHCSAIFLTVVM